jgi:hypothetical protein
MAEPEQAVHVSMTEPTASSPPMFPVNREDLNKIKDEVAKGTTKYKLTLP